MQGPTAALRLGSWVADIAAEREVDPSTDGGSSRGSKVVVVDPERGPVGREIKGEACLDLLLGMGAIKVRPWEGGTGGGGEEGSWLHSS
jgi:hypothetical protein